MPRSTTVAAFDARTWIRKVTARGYDLHRLPRIKGGVALCIGLTNVKGGFRDGDLVLWSQLNGPDVVTRKRRVAEILDHLP